MTVQELIEVLEKCDPKMEVILSVEDTGEMSPTGSLNSIYAYHGRLILDTMEEE